MKKQNGLAKQFMGMIALAALESVLLLTVSQVVLAKGLRFWFSRTEVQQHATQKQVQELQSYVTEHHPCWQDDVPSHSSAGAAELCDGTSSCQHGCKGTDGLEP